MNRAYLLALLTLVAACILCNGGWIKGLQTPAIQRNSGGTLRPELLRGIESRRLMELTLDIYLNTVNQALPS